MSVLAKCTLCEFSRRFSVELSGRFYRCPRCQKGVIAVPGPEDSSESSERPLRLSGSSVEAGQTPASTGHDPSASDADGSGPSYPGEIATARRILVECALCGFLVRIPAEFFGKSIHCPECTGNTIFSESTLEPVKDELLDRLTLESNERKMLFPPAGRQEKDRLAIKSFLAGVALGAVVLLAAWWLFFSD